MQLIDRQDIVSAVRDSMDRHDRSPLLVVEGARGTGKSALVAAVAGLVSRRVPHAVLDLEAVVPTPGIEVVSAVAFQLARRCPGYGAIAFPRLAIAYRVMQELPETGDREAARNAAIALVEALRRPGLREVLRESAGALVSSVGKGTGLPTDVAQPALRRLGDKALDRVMRHRPGRRLLLGDELAWFGHRGRGSRDDPADVLVELGRWARNPGVAVDRRAVLHLLWDALLTDVSAHFTGHRRSVLNALVMLDNVDGPLGTELLSTMQRVRGEREKGPDRLTFLVTSRGRILAGEEVTDSAATAPGRDALPAWIRLSLTDFTLRSTTRLVREAVPVGGDAVRVPAMVHRFSGGHPGATALLVHSLPRVVTDGRSTAERGLQDLLEARPAGRPAPPGTGEIDLRDSLAERLVAELMPGISAQEQIDLVTCAAARNRSDLLVLRDAGLLVDGERSLAMAREVLWPRAGGAAATVLRRLLVRRLATERAEGDLLSWNAVFGVLRKAAAGDRIGAAYYALALDDVAACAAHLAPEFGPVERWWSRVEQVIEAPRRPPGRRQTPADQVRALIGSASDGADGLEGLSTRLLARLWVVTDPFLDARRRVLHGQIAVDLENVAAGCGRDDVDMLLAAAGRHRAEGELWN